MLREIAEMGLSVAEALGRRVKARLEAGEPINRPGEDVGRSFELIAHEVRQAILMEARLYRDQPPPAPTRERPVTDPALKEALERASRAKPSRLN